MPRSVDAARTLMLPMLAPTSIMLPRCTRIIATMIFASSSSHLFATTPHASRTRPPPALALRAFTVVPKHASEVITQRRAHAPSATMHRCRDVHVVLFRVHAHEHWRREKRCLGASHVDAALTHVFHRDDGAAASAVQGSGSMTCGTQAVDTSVAAHNTEHDARHG